MSNHRQLLPLIIVKLTIRVKITITRLSIAN